MAKRRRNNHKEIIIKHRERDWAALPEQVMNEWASQMRLQRSTRMLRQRNDFLTSAGRLSAGQTASIVIETWPIHSHL